MCLSVCFLVLDLKGLSRLDLSGQNERAKIAYLGLGKQITKKRFSLVEFGV
jgi:hypothetical protein